MILEPSTKGPNHLPNRLLPETDACTEQLVPSDPMTCDPRVGAFIVIQND